MEIEIEKISPKMPDLDVTIAGELNLDLVLYGLPRELPPERELIASEMMITLGGSSAIVAHNLAALGNRVGFISRIGNDSLGQIALDPQQTPNLLLLSTPALHALYAFTRRTPWPRPFPSATARAARS